MDSQKEEMNKALVDNFLRVVLRITTPENIQWDIDIRNKLQVSGYINHEGRITEKGYVKADSILLEISQNEYTEDMIKKAGNSVIFHCRNFVKRPYGLTDVQWYWILDSLLKSDMINTTRDGLWQLTLKGKREQINLRLGVFLAPPDKIGSMWKS